MPGSLFKETLFPAIVDHPARFPQAESQQQGHVQPVSASRNGLFIRRSPPVPPSVIEANNRRGDHSDAAGGDRAAKEHVTP
jgi:hypothetical protein